MRDVCKLLTFCFLIVSLDVLSMGNNVPEGFEDFFLYQKQNLKFKLPNGDYRDVVLLVTYDSVKLTGDSAENTKIKRMLLDNNVKDEYTEKILIELSRGMTVRNNECKEQEILKCVLSLTDEDYAWVLDYDNKVLLLFISPNLLDEVEFKSDGEYQQTKKDNPATINHFAINFDKYDGTDFNYSINNEMMLGLNYGYIQSDVQYQSYNDEFDIYKIAYHLDFDRYNFRVGQFIGHESMNSTDFLREGSTLNGVTERTIDLGSSDNLLLGNKNGNKVLYFFSTSVGRLIVKNADNGRILLNRNTAPGQQYVSYSELPYGIYDVVLEVRNNDDVLLREEHTIYNKRTDNLVVNDYDFLLSVGQLESKNIVDNEKTNELMFARGLTSIKVHNSTLLGLGVTGSELGAIATAGLALDLPWSLSLQSTYNYANSGETYFNTMLNVAFLTTSFQEYKGGKDSNLASLLYGYGDSKSAYIGSSFKLFNLGQARLSAAYNFNKSDVTSINYENYNFAFGLGRQINNYIRMDMSLGYTTNSLREHFELDKLDGTFSVTINLDPQDFVSYRSTVHGYNRQISSIRNSLSASSIIERGNYRDYAEVSHVYNNVSESPTRIDTSYSANYKNNYLRANGLVTADTLGKKGASLGFDSSLIFANNKGYITSDKSSSYSIVDLQRYGGRQSADDNKLKAYLTVKDTGGQIKKVSLYNYRAVVPIDDYREYTIELNTDVGDLQNNGLDYASGYSYPSSVIELTTSVGVTKKVISGFKDIFDRPIVNLKCDGAGCLKVHKIYDGVFDITIFNNLPFNLRSDGLVCDLEIYQEKTNYGTNYCLPELGVGESILISGRPNRDKVVKYLGEYYKGSNISDFIFNIENSDIQFHMLDKRDRIAIYVSYRDKVLLSDKQLEGMDILLKFARTNNPIDIGEVRK
ncbi:CS1-pili formation C-terminal domain-containing protein [Vibrio hepatarius]|uniref:CS1-pili formation C-terminal domain-containing protein n=1 Tax=Vibrio hepatarius TaxID=171383 RepID=UPI0037364D56